MASTFKVLGQAAPAATTETVLYTVPADTSVIASTILVCNRAGAAPTFRLSISVGGGATATKDYMYFDTALLANDTLAITIGMTLAAGDVVRVFASTADLSFSLFGEERT